MRNMVFTKVEQITMIANDKFLWVRGWWKTRFSDELFSFLHQICVQNKRLVFYSSYKNYHVKKNLGVPFKRPTSLHCIRFVKEPGLLMKDSREIQQTHSAVRKMHTWFSSTDVWNQTLVFENDTHIQPDILYKRELVCCRWFTDWRAMWFFFFFF